MLSKNKILFKLAIVLMLISSCFFCSQKLMINKTQLLMKFNLTYQFVFTLFSQISEKYNH